MQPESGVAANQVRFRRNDELMPEHDTEESMTKRPSTSPSPARPAPSAKRLLAILKERKFPIGELVPLASERSAGSKVEFGNRSITVKNLADYDFDGIDIAFFSAGGSVSREHVPRAARRGRGRDRQHLGVPLPARRAAGGQRGESARDRAVPDARHHRQSELLDDADARRARADPSRGRHRAHQRRDVSVGVGHRPIARSKSSAGRPPRCSASRTSNPKIYPVQIAFNVIPHGGDFHRQRLHEGRDEDGLGDAQDPRATNRSR